MYRKIFRFFDCSSAHYSLVLLIIFGAFHFCLGYRQPDSELSSFEQDIVEHLDHVERNLGDPIEDDDGHTTVVFIAEADNSIENPGPSDAENGEVANPFQCENEIHQLQARVGILERELRLYKESELERFYKLSKRITYVVDALASSRVEDAQAQMNFLGDHIWEADVLQHISESILSALTAAPGFNSTVLQTSLPIVLPKNPGFQLSTIASLFDYQDQLGKLLDLDILRSMVQALTQALKRAATTQSWRKETEIKLINRIFVNVCNAMGSHTSSWVALKSWLSSNFFRAFINLSEREVLEVALDTIETQNDGMLSTFNQLRYLKILYHDCSTEDGLIHRHYWDSVDVFNRSFILSSIDQDILTRNASNNNDVGEAGLKYFQEVARDWNEALDDEYFNAENLLFVRMAEVFLHAAQSNAMAVETQRPEFWRLIKIFQPLSDVLMKYRFVHEEARMSIVEKYGNAINKIGEAIGFIQELPKVFSYISYKQLLSSMRENGHLHSPEIFRLASIFMTLGLHRDSIWEEIPEQVQLISDYSTDKGLIWNARTVNNSYEIYAQEDDLVLHLKPVHSEAEMGPHRVWIFDPVSSIYGPTKIQISLADFLSSPHSGGVVVASREDGTAFLRQISGPGDRKNGKFALLVPQLTESLDAVQLYFNAQPIGILFNEMGEAEGLGITSPPTSTDFVLFREE